jgi:hypothetical protein
MTSSPVNDRVLAMARRMALLALAVEVRDAFREAGIQALLLKGPVTAQWLYGDLQARNYRDVDLLVHPLQFSAACEILAHKGFVDVHRTSLAFYESENEVTFVRDSLCVDLHHNIVGIPPAQAASVVTDLFSDSVDVTLGSCRFRALSPSDRVAHLGWHLAQSPGDRRALADLDRALEVLTPSQWKAGAEAAGRRGGLDAFVAGVTQRPAGVALVRQLDVSVPRSLAVELRASGASHDALALLRWWGEPTRLRGVARALHVGRTGMATSDRPPMLRRSHLRAAVLVRIPRAVYEIGSARRRLRVQPAGEIPPPNSGLTR